MRHIVNVNEQLWNEASTYEKRRIHGQLIHAGLLPPDSAIHGTSSTPDREEAEIALRVKMLDARFPTNGYRRACKRAFEAVMARCDAIAFAKERKRSKNAAYQAYELCMISGGGQS